MSSKRVRNARIRLAATLVVFSFWSGAVVCRLVSLQCFQVSDYRERAVRQQHKTLRIHAERGSILDRNGELLAVCRRAQTACVYPREMGNIYLVAKKLSPILGIPRKKILQTCRLNRDAVYLKRIVPEATVEEIRTLGLEGVGFAPENTRHYPQERLACHLLGYTNRENLGCYGLEQHFNELICGKDGQWLFGRDAHGQPHGPGQRPPTAGCSLLTTLDEVAQFHTEEALDRAMKKTRAKGGTVVVLDCWTGDVLAMANQPDFDPNEYSDFSFERMRNRAITLPYEPGSTFKLITMAAALERGRLNLEEKIHCGNGRIRVGGRWIRDHKSFGLLSPTEIIAYSSNVGAMKIGLSVTAEEFYETIRAFGFGRITGVDLPAEEAGLVPRPGGWNEPTQATISFGQEISVTPLQLCRAVAAIASDGVLRVPRVVSEIRPSAVHEGSVFPPRDDGRALSTENAARLREMMAEVVRQGTGKLAASPLYELAGKTGTAQKVIDGSYSDTRHVASFAGFAPLENPRIAVVVVIDEPQGAAYHGGQVAAPVFREVAEQTLRCLGVPSSFDEVLWADALKMPGTGDDGDDRSGVRG